MNEEKSSVKPKKKKHSLWWLWFLLFLAAFGGGVVTGLKLNTLPLPNDVKDRLYPIIESYIPGATAERTPAPAPEEVPAPTPEATPEPAPEATPIPVVTEEPEAAPIPVATAEPEPAPAPTEPPVPVETPVLAETEEPASAGTPAPAEPAAPETPASREENGPVVAAAAPEREAEAARTYIGPKKALEIALKEAELEEPKSAEVTGVFRTKDEDGNSVYEVSFMVGEVSYEFVIDAFSGEIASWRLSGLTVSETSSFGYSDAAK